MPSINLKAPTRAFDINEALRLEENNLFVLNVTSKVPDMSKKRNKKTGKYPNMPASQVIFEVISGTGESNTVLVPVTWIPIDLTLQVNRKDLLNSQNFRRALQNKQLRLVPTAEALELLDDETAQIEQGNVEARLKHQVSTEDIIAGEFHDDDGDDDQEYEEEDEDDDRPGRSTIRPRDRTRLQAEATMLANPEHEVTAEERSAARVNPSVVDICARNDVTPSSVFSHLKLVEDELERVDWKYLERHLKDRFRDSKINDFILSKLSQ